VFDGPRVARVRLERHRSPRRNVLIAERMEISEGVVVEGTKRFAECFTLSSVLLEREQPD